MGHTNATPNYNLPQFLGSDKPAWLTDMNNAMSAIDTAIAAAKAAADSAGGAAAALSETVAGHTTQLTTLGNTVTTQGTTIVSQGNAINTISELIGNGTPTTTDHTLIGAINELNANKASEIITDTVSASEESVAANTAKTFQISCTKAGYTPIAISSYTISGTYNDEVSVYRVDFVSDKSKVIVGCRNMHAGANSIGATVVILYQKI